MLNWATRISSLLRHHWMCRFLAVGYLSVCYFVCLWEPSEARRGRQVGASKYHNTIEYTQFELVTGLSINSHIKLGIDSKGCGVLFLSSFLVSQSSRESD